MRKNTNLKIAVILLVFAFISILLVTGCERQPQSMAPTDGDKMGESLPPQKQVNGKDGNAPAPPGEVSGILPETKPDDSRPEGRLTNEENLKVKREENIQNAPKPAADLGAAPPPGGATATGQNHVRISKTTRVKVDQVITRKIAKGKRLPAPAPVKVGQATYTPQQPPTPDEPKDDAMFFKKYGTNPFVDTEDDHLSTFSIDVDTASYTIARKYLNSGKLPDDAAVRVEEFVNYFKYGYAPPEKGDFAVNMEASPSKFGKNCDLLRIGIKGREVKKKERKRAILTFVIDVSGSMNRGNRLGLVKQALEILVNQLQQGDQIGIVVYGSRAMVIMEHKGAENKQEIINAINQLRTMGSTNAEDGIMMAYQLANKNFQKGAINRVILCSDGVANVGRTGPEAILKQVEEYTKDGIYLTTVGFGMSNYNDVMMEKLADKGNGNYAYVDDLKEAKRVFVENLTGTLQTIAKDVKIQVDFDPKVVRSYRLVGYENRDIADRDFRNDKKDAGEVGAGHSVTALYEVKLWPGKQGKAATVFIRYKDPENNKVTEFNRTLNTNQFKKSFEGASDSFKLAASVAEFAEILKNSYWAKESSLKDVIAVVKGLGANYQDNPDVKELINLMATAEKLKK